MSNSLRTIALGTALVSAAALLPACTAGEIVAADGTALTTYHGPSTITFTSQTTFQKYTITPVENGGLTFSFDPFVAQSATNGSLIPAGTYKLDVTLCTDATHCQPYGHWETFNLDYGQSCTDANTGQTVPCSLFKVVRCNWPADFQKYGAALCTGSSVSGSVTTVGVLDGP